jgi:hypothetical protein
VRLYKRGRRWRWGTLELVLGRIHVAVTLGCHVWSFGLSITVAGEFPRRCALGLGPALLEVRLYEVGEDDYAF